MKTYDIDGTQYTQGRLTVGSLLRLVRLVKGRAAGVALDFDSVMALLDDADLLREFLSCVLTGPVQGIDPHAVPAETLVEVVADFLSLNASLLPKLLDSLKSISSAVTALPGATTAA